MPSEVTDQVAYVREVQRFHQVWLWVVVVAAAAAAWLPLGLLLTGSDETDRGPVWLAVLLAVGVGIGLPLLFGLARLVVEVYADRIEIRYRPFASRVIRLTDVTRADAVTYHPIREYGGWGIKGWTRRKVAYNVSGDRGVLLVLRDERTVLLGSQHPEELAAGIAAALDGVAS